MPEQMVVWSKRWAEAAARGLRALLRRAGFPLLVLALPALGLGLLRHEAPTLLATLLPLTLGAALVAFLERTIPYHPAWNRSRGDLGLDAAYLGLTLLTASATQGWVAGTASVAGAGAWPGGWPFPLQVAGALLVGDLGLYLVHRASHEWSGLLWRIHSVHHSAERLYWLNSTRFHPLNAAWNVALKTWPLALLGAPRDVVLVAGLVSGLQNFASHANLDLRSGVLNRIFSTPEVHRWHHARNVREANANYGGTLVVWDLAFGTWSLPAGRLASDGVGLQDQGGYPASLGGQMAYPLAAWRTQALLGRLRISGAPGRACCWRG